MSEVSETDLVLPKRNSGSEARVVRHEEKRIVNGIDNMGIGHLDIGELGGMGGY
jgi:hypothetical protein